MDDHFVLPLPPSLEVPLTSPTTHYEQMTSSSPDAAAASQHEPMTNSTTTNYVQPTTTTPTEGVVPSPLTFETTRQAPQEGTNATCYTTATTTTTTTTTPMVGVDRIPSKLASRSFGSARSNRSRRSTRSRDSARSHNNNNRIVYSTTAHYDTWMIFLLSLPILFIFLWMVVLVSTYDHWERSPTEWILSWSLLLLVGLYMVVLPKQLNIRSNGSLGIKTFLCTFHFSNVCHVSRATTHNTTTPTGTPIEHYYNNDNKNDCAAVSSWEPPRQGVWWGPLLRVHRLRTSVTSIPCVLRRRRRAAAAVEQGQEIYHSDHNGGLLWDVHVTPHNPTEFVQHFESVLTRLEIQRANANVAHQPVDGTADSAMNGVFATTTGTAGSVGGMGDSSVSYHHHNRVPQQEDHPPLAVVTATFV